MRVELLTLLVLSENASELYYTKGTYVSDLKLVQKLPLGSKPGMS